MRMQSTDDEIVERLNSELRRLGAEDAQVALDYDFEPDTGPLARMQVGDAYWHFMTLDLMRLLEPLPNNAGSDAILQTIEQNATTVWHGPAPQGSRDTSF
jgi:hypothetical protein